MADIIQFPNQDERAIAQFVKGFGLEYPKDAEKFFEIFFGHEEGEKTVGELFDELIEAFPDKKESILNFPMYAEIDGELVRVRLPEKD
ncbi:MAG: hypothetical protein KAI93_10390 [Desulfobacterales bacterium]|nr:hypothetical protein [Desulfobacterales bacterium]